MGYASFDAILNTLDTLTGVQLSQIQHEIDRILVARQEQQPVEQIPSDAVPVVGGYLRQEYSKCGKERCKVCATGQGHGPYWYRYVYRKGGGHKRVYVGKEKPTG